jgi:hypothetical protein
MKYQEILLQMKSLLDFDTYEKDYLYVSNPMGRAVENGRVRMVMAYIADHELKKYSGRNCLNEISHYFIFLDGDLPSTSLENVHYFDINKMNERTVKKLCFEIIAYLNKGIYKNIPDKFVEDLADAEERKKELGLDEKTLSKTLSLMQTIRRGTEASDFITTEKYPNGKSKSFLSKIRSIFTHKKKEDEIEFLENVLKYEKIGNITTKEAIQWIMKYMNSKDNVRKALNYLSAKENSNNEQ